jgi:hypothetical protein
MENSGQLYLTERAPGIHRIGGQVDPQILEEKTEKTPAPARNRTPVF